MISLVIDDLYSAAMDEADDDVFMPSDVIAILPQLAYRGRWAVNFCYWGA